MDREQTVPMCGNPVAGHQQVTATAAAAAAATAAHPSRRSRAARLRRIGHGVFTVGAVGVVVGLLGLGVAVRTGHLSFAPVLSGSMQPAIRTGDLAVIWPVAAATLRVGDVISFYPPGDTTTPKLHRIVSLTHGTHGLTVITKGDANQGNDPWTATLRGSTAYRLIGVIPLLGWTTVSRIGHSISHVWVSVVLVLSGVLLGLSALSSLRRKSVVNRRTAAKGNPS